jgi:hypothetical protein
VCPSARLKARNLSRHTTAYPKLPAAKAFVNAPGRHPSHCKTLHFAQVSPVRMAVRTWVVKVSISAVVV